MVNFGRSGETKGSKQNLLIKFYLINSLSVLNFFDSPKLFNKLTEINYLGFRTLDNTGTVERSLFLRSKRTAEFKLVSELSNSRAVSP